MAYVSYTLRNETSAIDGSIRRWLMDNNDTPATIDTAGYITDARTKGLQVGDIITYRQWTTAPVAPSSGRSNPGVDPSAYGAFVALSTHIVLSIAVNGSANLSDATVNVVTNTD
jgi:hypothetical protein